MGLLDIVAGKGVVVFFSHHFCMFGSFPFFLLLLDCVDRSRKEGRGGSRELGSW